MVSDKELDFIYQLYNSEDLVSFYHVGDVFVLIEQDEKDKIDYTSRFRGLHIHVLGFRRDLTDILNLILQHVKSKSDKELKPKNPEYSRTFLSGHDGEIELFRYFIKKGGTKEVKGKKKNVYQFRDKSSVVWKRKDRNEIIIENFKRPPFNPWILRTSDILQLLVNYSGNHAKSLLEKDLITLHLPLNDNILKEEGLEIEAKTSYSISKPFGYDSFDYIKNQLTFILGKRKRVIKCIHTVLDRLQYNDDDEYLYQVKDYEEIHLGPDQHHFALNSFIQAILEQGLENVFLESLKSKIEGRDWIDINVDFRSQFLTVLFGLSRKLIRAYFTYIIEYFRDLDVHRLEIIFREFPRNFFNTLNKKELDFLFKTLDMDKFPRKLMLSLFKNKNLSVELREKIKDCYLKRTQDLNSD